MKRFVPFRKKGGRHGKVVHEIDVVVGGAGRVFLPLLALLFCAPAVCSGGTGIYIDDIEVGAGKPPKGCGWIYEEREIACKPLGKPKEYERTVTFIGTGANNRNFELTGSNTTDHIQFVVDVSCRLHLRNFVLKANEMVFVKHDFTGNDKVYSRVYDAFTIGSGRKVDIIAHGKKVRVTGSNQGVWVCRDAELGLLNGDGKVDFQVSSIVNLGLTMVYPECSVNAGGQLYLVNEGEFRCYGTSRVRYLDSFDYIVDLTNGRNPTVRNSGREVYNDYSDDYDIEFPGKTEYRHVYSSDGCVKIYSGSHVGSVSCQYLEVHGLDADVSDADVECEKALITGGHVEVDHLHATDSVEIAGGDVRVLRKEIKADKISISGGTVYANAGIVGGDVEISGGAVTAFGYRGQILRDSPPGSVFLWMSPNADRGEQTLFTRAAIGGRSVLITGGNVRANCEFPDLPYDSKVMGVMYPTYTADWSGAWQILGTAGIGGPECPVTIRGGTVTAVGGCSGTDFSKFGHSYSGAGIGGNWMTDAGVITITGGDVTAYGGAYSCAIGPGSGFRDGRGPIISGGYVQVMPGDECPAIYSSSSHPAQFNGGTVEIVPGHAASVLDVADVGGYHGEGCLSCVVRGGILNASSNRQEAEDGRGDYCCRVTVRNPSRAGQSARIAGLPYDYSGARFDAEGVLRLWLPGWSSYSFTVDDRRYEVTLKDKNNSATDLGVRQVTVTIDANGGEFSDGDKVRTESVNYGSLFDILAYETPKREGYYVISWSSPPHSDEPLVADVAFTAKWEKKKDTSTQPPAEKGQRPQTCFIFRAEGGTFPDGSDEVILAYEIGETIHLDDIPRPKRTGYEFYGWIWRDFYDGFTLLEEGDVVSYGLELMPAWVNQSPYVSFYYVTGPMEDYRLAPSYAVQRYQPDTHVSAGTPIPGREFVGWFSEPNGKGYQFEDWSTLTDEDVEFFSYFRLVCRDWTMNRYQCASLDELGVYAPLFKDVKKVTAENLPKGLSLVQDKSTGIWFVEGVPTERRDVETNFVAIRFQMAEKGAPDDVQKLMLNIQPDPHEELQVTLGAVLDPIRLSDVVGLDVDKTWKVSGATSGLKYTDKDNTKWKDDAKAEHVANAFTLYGQPNAVGPMTIVAKRPVASTVPGQKGSFTEVYSIELLVRPASNKFDATYDVDINSPMTPIDLTGVFALAADSKTKASGVPAMPAGVKFTTKALPKEDAAAGSLYGTPTKAGIYALTFKNGKEEVAYVLVRVSDPATPELSAYFGTKKKMLVRAIVKGVEKAEQNTPIPLMVGANTVIPITTGAGATVKQSNLPKGLNLVQDKTTKTWSISGYPTQAGSFLTKLTVTENKVASTITYLFEVSENEFAGDYRGVVTSSPGGGMSGRLLVPGLVTVNVAAGGATKVILTEHGKVAYTYSAKSFDWDDINGNASIAFDVPLTKAQIADNCPQRTFRIDIVDRGHGYRIVSGRVIHTERDGSAFEESFKAWPVVGVDVLNEHRVFDWNMPTSWTFNEEDDVLSRPVALVSVAPPVKDANRGPAVGDAKAVVKLADGTTAKIAKLPVLRVGGDLDDRGSYAYAPFAVTGAKADGSRVYLFHGLTACSDEGYVFGAFPPVGTVTYEGPDGSSARELPASDASPYRFGQEYVAELLSGESIMTCDFGEEGLEMFTLVRGETYSADGAHDTLMVYDLVGELLATWKAQYAKDTGTTTLKYTTKDKVHTYTFDLACLDFYEAAGIVTDAWKDGKTAKTAVGTVRILKVR